MVAEQARAEAAHEVQHGDLASAVVAEEDVIALRAVVAHVEARGREAPVELRVERATLASRLERSPVIDRRARLAVSHVPS